MAGSAGSADMAGSATTPAADADHITVFATHKDKKPDDPVQVKFTKYAITKATFDPAKIEGGTATIEIDTTSLSSGKAGRDEHLQKADYLDVPKFAKIIIDVSNVKKKDGKTYSADAKVQAVGTTKTYPVTFEVVESKDNWIKVKGEHTFARTDFKIGKDPKDAKESVAGEVTIKMQLTLKKT
jgi:polyisoprenoid-binding protein YceI